MGCLFHSVNLRDQLAPLDYESRFSKDDRKDGNEPDLVHEIHKLGRVESGTWKEYKFETLAVIHAALKVMIILTSTFWLTMNMEWAVCGCARRVFDATLARVWMALCRSLHR